MNKEDYINKSFCGACGGQCCKNMAGTYAPEDFQQEITSDFILSLFKSGTFAVDWWEGDARIVSDSGDEPNHYDLSRTCYIRPRHKGREAVEASWGGSPCMHFTEGKGCGLTFEERPYQCRMLIPQMKGKHFHCTYRPADRATRRDMAVRWVPFQKEIEEAINKYRGL